MRISYIHGICVDHDAISNSIRDEITWLLSVPGNEIRLFTYLCDFQELPFTIVRDLKDVVFDIFFQQSDVVIFHFGVYYPLFNILPVVPRAAKKIVVFHNITPKEFLPVSAHETLDKSFQQMGNIAFADHVFCVSRTNQDVLSLAGIAVPSTVQPLALRGEKTPPKRKPSFDDGKHRILFVGRLVESKGPVDLLIAVSTVLAERDGVSLELDFVGNLKFSDPNVLAQVQSLSEKLLDRYGERLTINLHGNISESVKNELLAKADLFVLPTRHEGFCVPILEAFQNGCCVISYDNSNVPHISGGFAKLALTGDTVSLAREISAALDLTQSEEWIAKGGYLGYCSDLSDYCKQFDPEKVSSRFLNLVDEVYRCKGSFCI
jgi:glycosyltransferase involved in cell wall biosynthesis